MQSLPAVAATLLSINIATPFLLLQRAHGSAVSAAGSKSSSSSSRGPLGLRHQRLHRGWGPPLGPQHQHSSSSSLEQHRAARAAAGALRFVVFASALAAPCVGEKSGCGFMDVVFYMPEGAPVGAPTLSSSCTWMVQRLSEPRCLLLRQCVGCAASAAREDILCHAASRAAATGCTLLALRRRAAAAAAALCGPGPQKGLAESSCGEQFSVRRTAALMPCRLHGPRRG